MTASPARLPGDLKPADGRFGCGPSKVRPEALAELAERADGDGHLAPPGAGQGPGRRRREGLGELFGCRTATRSRSATAARTAFWDAAAACLVRERALHLAYGEFSSKFAKVTAGAPVPRRPDRRRGRAGRRARSPLADPGADVIAWAHNETSTGVMVGVERPAGAGEALVLIDATSAPAACRSTGQADAYYFAPQKALRRRRRLWLALLSPAAIDADRAARRRRRTLAAGVPLAARSRSRTRARTRPTTRRPWRRCSCSPTRSSGCWAAAGSTWCVQRSRTSAAHLYGWAERREFATPVRRRPGKRSPVVGTIDFSDEVDAAALAGDPARERDRRRRALPQARPQPAAGRDVPGGRARRRRGADGLRRLGASRTPPRCGDERFGRADADGSGPPGAGQGEDRRRRASTCCATSSTSSSASRCPSEELDAADRRVRRDPDPLGARS